ncbi:hypothetical protein ACVWW4_003896 [Bradyrhizobium sp. LB7.1]
MEMICAFKLLVFLSSIGGPMENQESDRGRRRTTNTPFQIGRLDVDAPTQSQNGWAPRAPVYRMTTFA